MSAPGTKRSGIRYTYVLTDGQYIESHGNSMISSLSTHTLNILISSRSSYIYKKMSRRSSSSSASSDFVRRLRVIFVLPDIDIFTTWMATSKLYVNVYIDIYQVYIVYMLCIYCQYVDIYLYRGICTIWGMCAKRLRNVYICRNGVYTLYIYRNMPILG